MAARKGGKGPHSLPPPTDMVPLEDDESDFEDDEEQSDDDDDGEESEEDDDLGSGEWVGPIRPPYARGGRVQDDDDDDLSELNNPDLHHLGEAPVLGASPTTSDLFGDSAESFGQSSSPKLYAQAAHFPTAVQFRVWRWENGIPVALGAIDAEATEEEFVRRFYDAMPDSGEGKFQFRFRPVDMRGKELGKEFTLNFSEHHAEVRRIRRQKEREREEKMGRGDPLLINQGDGGNAVMAEEMGRMFEQAVESAERRTELLQATLESERERLREEEKSRYQERASLADRSTDVVTKMTDRLMQSDRQRADDQIKAQRDQNQLLLTTVTTVFQQQQEAARGQAERNRESDTARMMQDREFFERQRLETEQRLIREREEGERKAAREREEWERRRISDKEESGSRVESERNRLELEAKRIEEQRKYEIEQMRMESDRREKEADRRRETEKEEARLRSERDRLDMERQANGAREERERWRAELDTKRQADREEWERKQAVIREESERKERADRERMDHEKQEFQLRMEREKQEVERRDALRREEMERSRQEFQLRIEKERQESERQEARRRDDAQREADRRREEIQLQQKQMELSAEKDRQHAERMVEMARLEREAQREAQLQREKMEREARDSADRERERQHAMALKQIEMDREQGRDHQERMVQMAKIQAGGGLGGLGAIGETLGMQAPEILQRIFGAKDDDDEAGWASAIPKVLGTIAELGKAAMTAPRPEGAQVHGRRQLPGQVVQTAQGPMLVPFQSAPGVPMGVGPQMGAQRPSRPGPVIDLPDQGFVPTEFKDDDEDGPSVSPVPSKDQPAEEPGTIDLLKRAKEGGMSLPRQKKARRAVRVLVETLSDSPEDDWLGLVTEAVTNEISIYDYLKAVTVYEALEEAGADKDLADRVVAAMRGSGFIPDEVPYTEEDYTKLRAEKAEKAGKKA